jgi:hypothetical protein
MSDDGRARRVIIRHMPAQPPRQRLLRLLRRSAKASRATGARSTADDSALWSAHERALLRTRDAGAAAQRIASTASRQRTALDAVADRARALSSRAAELQAGFVHAVDAFERLGLIALNAGLEGARLGETEGRQLALVSDDVRRQSARGGDAVRELSSGLGQVATELGQVESQVAQAQAVVAEVAQDSARTAGAASDVESALLDMSERVKRATGSDPEAVRAVAEASERGRALVASLAALSGKVPRPQLVNALQPMLSSLARLLADGELDDEAERDREP